jgi:hypothetical protein
MGKKIGDPDSRETSGEVKELFTKNNNKQYPEYYFT